MKEMHINPRVALDSAVFIFVLLFLNACGGGSGSDKKIIKTPVTNSVPIATSTPDCVQTPEGQLKVIPLIERVVQCGGTIIHTPTPPSLNPDLNTITLTPTPTPGR